MKIFLLTLHSRERQKFKVFQKNSHKFHNGEHLRPLQYTTAHKNAVLTKKRKFYPNIYLPTIPPRIKFRFCRKFAKILTKNFFLTLKPRERQKFNHFYNNSHKFHNCGYLPPTLNSWERSKVNLLGQKSFLLTLKPREGVKIKGFEKIFFAPHL